MPVQTIIDGPRNVVVKIASAAGEAGLAVDVSELDPPCTRVNINRIWYSCLDAEDIELNWMAAVPEPIMFLHGQQDYNFDRFGGLVNNAGAGVNGDVSYTMPSGGGTVVIHFTKHGVIDYPR